MICGFVLVALSAFTVGRQVRDTTSRTPGTIAATTAPPARAPAATPRRVAVHAATPAPTRKPTAAPTRKPTATPTRKPTAAPTRKPTAAPSRKPTAAPTRKPTAAPSRKPTAAPTRKPTATPAPAATRKPAAVRPHPVQTAIVDLVGGRDEEACVRAVRFLRTAADDRVSRLDAYNAAVSGLAANRDCPEPRRSVNEAYLRAMRAPAEFALHIGDWNADLSRSDALLDACAGTREFHATAVARDCAKQRRFNDIVRKRIVQGTTQ
ncbi:MAG: hypothetical protein JWM87_4047 [Candidatus Eremiobacteraeota bacterium]|nr:hypothetical protein [Candidatus Eremiobacteraeota bacterium]